MELTSAQMTALQGAHDETFIDIVIRDLRTHLHAETKPFTEDQLRQIVRHGFARARARRLSTRYALALFVEMMFIVAPGFDRHPTVRTALNALTGDDHTRIDRAVDLSSAEIREARALSGDADWGLGSRMDS